MIYLQCFCFFRYVFFCFYCFLFYVNFFRCEVELFSKFITFITYRIFFSFASRVCLQTVVSNLLLGVSISSLLFYSLRGFLYQRLLTAFHWSLSDSRSIRVSKTLLGIQSQCCNLDCLRFSTVLASFPNPFRGRSKCANYNYSHVPRFGFMVFMAYQPF